MGAAHTRLAAALVLLGVTVAGLPSATQERAPVAYTAEIDGIIHPIAVEYIRGAISKAEEAGAEILVITLRTPGGLVDSTRDINSAIIASDVPVAVFVGPSGSRAASAGFLITIAADIAAMAPGTHIGAAHPVAGDGRKIDETMEQKVVSDVASYARTLAAKRNRNVDLVEKAVTESRSFTEEEAIKADPPLIDLIADDVGDLLRQLDGRTITRFDGSSEILRTADLRREHVSMTWAQKALSALAHPQIAYLLLMLGTLGLTIELWNPGAIFPGVVGAIALVLAFFALQVLPVNYAGVLLIVLGLVLLILEVKVTSFGVLAVGGILCLLLGSMMLVDSPLPELQIGLRLIVPVTLTLAAIILALVGLAVKAQKSRSVTGAAGMIDEVGRALTAIEPGGVGRVHTHGEIWTATSEEPISEGDPVRVVAVKGLVLMVRPDSVAPPRAASVAERTPEREGAGTVPGGIARDANLRS